MISHFIRQIALRGLEVIGRYYGTYLATVCEVDDPNNQDRVQLIIPQVTGTDPYPVWALPKNIYSGKDYGVQLPISKGETVWVSFQFGSVKKPLWERSYYRVKEKPQEFGGVDEAFKSIRGHIVTFSGSDIIIQFKDGPSITINKDVILVGGDKTVAMGEVTENVSGTVSDLLNSINSDLGVISGILNGLVPGSATTVSTNVASRTADLTGLKVDIKKIQSSILKGK